MPQLRTLCVLLAIHLSSAAPRQRCVEKHNVRTDDAFGISKVNIPHGITVPALWKRVCLTEDPSLPAQYHNHTLNLLNMTSSMSQCHAVYSLFACHTNYPYEKDLNCELANQIVFALMQRMPTCKTDADCVAGTALMVPPIHCNWAKEIRAAVCPTCTQTLHCADNIENSLALDSGQACALTSALCSTVIEFTILIAFCAAFSYFIMVTSIIYVCSAYRKKNMKCPDKALVSTPPLHTEMHPRGPISLYAQAYTPIHTTTNEDLSHERPTMACFS